MSHFTVLVIGEDVEGLLAPFHEFECTGEDDQYIQDIDETEEMRLNYDGQEVDKVRLSDGTIKDVYDDEFWPPADEATAIKAKEHYKETRQTLLPDGRKFSLIRTNSIIKPEAFDVKIFTLPEGAEKVVLNPKDYETFREHVANYTDRTELVKGDEHTEDHKYGYTLIDANGEVIRTVNRTNPNSKWDWYQIGGRWSGMLSLKGEAIEALKHHKVLSEKGNPIPESLQGRVDRIYTGTRSWMNREEEMPKWLVDSAPIGEIDFDGIKKQQIEDAKKSWGQYQDECRKKILGDDTEAKLVGNGDEVSIATPPVVFFDDSVAHPEVGVLNYLHGVAEGDTLETYIAKRSSGFSTYAVIKDGEWYERGAMGWWGMSSGEKDADVWQEEFDKLLAGLTPDTQITVVDCHI